MLNKELTLKVCRDIIQNAKCDMDKFERITMYYYFLTNSFEAVERYEKEFISCEYGSKEADAVWEKVKINKNRVNEYVAIIAIESAL